MLGFRHVMMGVNNITDLLAYYKYEGNPKDSSGRGNDGTNLIGFTYTDDRFLNPNSALYSTSGAACTFGATLEDDIVGLTEFTYNEWVKIDGTSGDPNRLLGVCECDAFEIYLRNTAPPYLIYVNLRYDDLTTLIKQSSSLITGGEWHMITITFDNGVLKYYLDNIMIFEYTDLSKNTLIYNEGTPLTVGWGALRSFTGSRDQFRFYKKAISDDERTALFNETN